MTDKAGEYHQERGILTSYGVPSHDLIDAVEGKGRWGHLKGHGKFSCPIFEQGRSFRDLGYAVSSSDCDCGYHSQFANLDRPTLCPLEHMVYDDLSVLWADIGRGEPRPLIPSLSKCHIRFIDELNWSHFIGEMDVSREDVELLAEIYPDMRVKALCKALLRAMGVLSRIPHKGYHPPAFSGPDLYEELGNLEGLEDAQTYDYPWWDEEPNRVPKNFPSYLIPIMLWETRHTDYSPRIHVSAKQIRIRWRKKLVPHHPTVVADASAPQEMVEKLFGMPVNRVLGGGRIDLSGNISIAQLADHRLGAGTLKPSLDKWLGVMQERLEGFDRSLTIGVVTLKKVEKRAVRKVRSMGFANVSSLHYYNLRSKNGLKNVDVLVLLGCPIPDTSDCLEHAQAFYYDETAFASTAWTAAQVVVTIGPNLKIAQRFGGFRGDPRLKAYFEQLCNAELYQALHRARPLRAKRKLDIIVLTNNPIGYAPNEYIRDKFDARREQVKELVRKGLSERWECGFSDIYKAVPGLNREWLRTNAEGIAAELGCGLNRQAGRRGSRFLLREAMAA